VAEEREQNQPENQTVDYQRQLDIFDPEIHNGRTVEIIGAGGIGSFVALALAKLGLKHLRVWDGDDLEAHNVPNQFHLVKALGKKKVVSTKTLCKEMADTEIEVVPEFWEPGKELNGLVISAVDSMGITEDDPRPGRKELWEAVRVSPSVELLIDARLGGETIRVLSIRPINDALKHGWYESNLFTDKEGADLPCTGRSIIDVGFAVAAIITRLVRGYLKDGEVIHDIVLSMRDLTLIKVEV